jgi:DNA-directed RNA polymerase subunit delta
MKRVIVDYAKLTNEILNLLVEKFPDGYDDSNIVRFRNAKNELIEAVEVRTDDTIYLVKVSMKLADRIENYDEDEEIDDVIEPIIPMKANGMDDDMDDDEDEDDNIDRPDVDEDDEDSDDSDFLDEEEEDDDSDSKD